MRYRINLNCDENVFRRKTTKVGEILLIVKLSKASLRIKCGSEIFFNNCIADYLPVIDELFLKLNSLIPKARPSASAV